MYVSQKVPDNAQLFTDDSMYKYNLRNMVFLKPKIHAAQNKLARIMGVQILKQEST